MQVTGKSTVCSVLTKKMGHERSIEERGQHRFDTYAGRDDVDQSEIEEN